MHCATHLDASSSSLVPLNMPHVPYRLKMHCGVVHSAIQLALLIAGLGPGPYEFHRLTFTIGEAPGEVHIEAVGASLDLEELRRANLTKAIPTPNNKY